MTPQEFEIEIQKIDQRFTIIENPNRPGLSNIFFNGKNYDLPVISSTEIRDEIDTAYQYEFPNGMRARFWSKGEVTARLEDFLKKFKAGSLTEYDDE